MEHNSSLSDEALAVRVQNGDTESFGTLVTRYEPKLLRYGRRFISERDDIDDIVQVAFIRAYENIQGFDATQKFSPWMYRIAHNAFVNELKRKSRYSLLPDFDTFVSFYATEDPAEGERERSEMRQFIERGLSTLKPQYRECIILYYFEEMGYKEIADILQIPIGTVGIRIKRAKEQLKAAYQTMADKNLYGIS